MAAGEAGTVYALDAATGRERWTFETLSGIVSWPALAGDTIVVGTDAGDVIGLDPATGEQRWTLAAGGPVEAPIVVDEEDGTVYVASRDGSLAAFDPSDCAETCEADWSVEPGGVLRNAPLIAPDRVFVVDEDGQVIAVSKADGKRLWALGGPRYVGAPVLVDETIVVATARGTVERITFEGARLDLWDARTAATPADGEPAFAYGPVLGGDALWLGDSNAVVRRLGAPPIGQIPSIGLAWLDQATRPPFTASQLRTSVVEHDGKAVVVDHARAVFALDPATGRGSRLFDLPGEGLMSQVDQLVVGDTLLAIGGRTMQAVDLRTGQLQWQATAPGITIRPPIVSGQTVLWVTNAEGVGSILALDLAGGTPRWTASLGAVGQVGGVIASDDSAYSSTPPAAWDLQTGAQRWQTIVSGVALGGPVLEPDGQTVYVGGINAAGTTGFVAALDAATGAVRWQIDLDDAIMAPLDRLWAVDGLVVVPDLSGKVIVLDAASGAERWRFAPPTDRLGTITVARDRVWFMLENARLYGLDLATGRPLARFTELELSLNGQGLTQRPTFVGDRLLFPAGALRSRRLIRFSVLAIWALTTTASMVGGGVGDVLTFAIGILTLLAVPIAFAVFAFTRPRRVLEMLTLLVLVTANNAFNQFQGVQTWQTSGMPLMVLRVSFDLAGLGLVIMPLLLLVGMDVADFAFRAAGWVTSIAEERLARWVPWLLLGGLLAWRLWETIGEVAGWLADGPLNLQVVALAGGLSTLILVGVAWLAVRALAPPPTRCQTATPSRARRRASPCR